MATITVLGLGIIGSIWARHYQQDGHELKSWNRSSKPDAPGFEADLAESVRSSHFIHLCVADPAAVQSLLHVVLPHAPRNALIIQSSTISPAASLSFAEQSRTAGHRYVEAPFTGSKPAAEARQLVFFMGGNLEDTTEALSLLQSLSRKQFFIGKPHQASAIKLAMNLQIAAVAQALTEGWHLAKQFGLDHDLFYSVLRENVAHSGLAELKEPKLKSGDYSPQFSVQHMRKDLGLALESSSGLQLRLTERAKEIYDLGMQAGLGSEDFISLEKLASENL
ncbi:MAG: NAD(P)-dependent oxidoreductase [Candidatus Methylacidiphilales bacterium]